MTDELRNMELLYNALRAKRGTVVETPDPERLRQRLYALRRKYAEFHPLSFVISPANGVDLWILNKGVPVNGQEH